MASDHTKRKRQSVLFASLAKCSEKRYVRGDLEPGKEYAVSATIDAKVGRAAVTTAITGKLHVGEPYTTARSVAAPPEQVVAALIAHMPPSTRVRLLKELRASFTESGTLSVTKSQLDEAKAWLATLRSQKPSLRAGTISFITES